MSAWRRLAAGVRDRIERDWLARWHGLAERERRVLAAAAVLLPLMLLVFGVLLPLHDAHRRLQADAAAMERMAVEAERLAERILARGDAATAPRRNLMAMVESLARETGVRAAMSRIRPQPAAGGGQRLLVEFRDAPYAALVRFVDRLARGSADLVEMRVQRASTSGRVHARAVIRSGA